MSFIYRDFLTPSRYIWNTNARLFHRFDRVWNKIMVDGIEVYDNRLVYWSGAVRSDEPFKRFLNALGLKLSTLQNQSYEGVSSVFFTLTPSKYSYTAIENTQIVTDINTAFTQDQTFELIIHYTGESSRIVPNHFTSTVLNPTTPLDYSIDTAAIRAQLEDNPFKYFANADLAPAGISQISWLRSNTITNLHLDALRPTPITTPVTMVEVLDPDTTPLIATLALLDNGSVFERVNITGEITTIHKKSTNTMTYYDYTYKVQFKYKTPATTTSYLVNQINILSTAMQNSLRLKSGNVIAITNHVVDTSLKRAVIAMNNTASVGIEYRGYLRVDAVRAMKRNDFAKMLGKILGTDYTKVKTKWYQKALAIVLVIVAIVIGVASAGGLSVVSTDLVALGVALMTTTAVLTVGQLLYAAVFPYATDMTRVIGKAAQITGFAAMVTGIYAAIQNSWKNYIASEVAKKTVTNMSQEQASILVAKEAGLSGYIQYLFQSSLASIGNYFTSIGNKFSSFFTSLVSPSQWTIQPLTNITMTDVSGWMKNLNTSLDMYMKFFGDKTTLPSAMDEQAIKEDGVSPYYAAISMIDEVDALVKMDSLVKNSTGGQSTENFLTKIY